MLSVERIANLIDDYSWTFDQVKTIKKQNTDEKIQISQEDQDFIESFELNDMGYFDEIPLFERLSAFAFNINKLFHESNLSCDGFRKVSDEMLEKVRVHYQFYHEYFFDQQDEAGKNYIHDFLKLYRSPSLLAPGIKHYFAVKVGEDMCGYISNRSACVVLPPDHPWSFIASENDLESRIPHHGRINYCSKIPPAFLANVFDFQPNSLFICWKYMNDLVENDNFFEYKIGISNKTMATIESVSEDLENALQTAVNNYPKYMSAEKYAIVEPLINEATELYLKNATAANKIQWEILLKRENIIAEKNQQAVGHYISQVCNLAVEYMEQVADGKELVDQYHNVKSKLDSKQISKSDDFLTICMELIDKSFLHANKCTNDENTKFYESFDNAIELAFAQ